MREDVREASVVLAKCRKSHRTYGIRIEEEQIMYGIVPGHFLLLRKRLPMRAMETR